MKSSHNLLKLFFVIILSNALCLASDSLDDMRTRDTRRVKIIDYVRKGAIAARQKDFKSAYGYYRDALSFLNKSLSGAGQNSDQLIDLTGKISHKEIDAREGADYHQLYSDEWPLKKRAALIANYAAEMAHCLKDYEAAALLYGEAGDLCQEFGIAQAWYLAAAYNAFRTKQYDKTLEYANLSGKMAQKCTPSQVGNGRGFEPLVRACADWVKILITRETLEITNEFFIKWKNFKELYGVEQEKKEKAQETLVKLDDNGLEQQLANPNHQRVRRTFRLKVSSAADSVPLLVSTTSSTSL